MVHSKDTLRFRLEDTVFSIEHSMHMLQKRGSYGLSKWIINMIENIKATDPFRMESFDNWHTKTVYKLFV